METIKLTKADLQIGVPVAWPIFDRDGNLLVKPGQTITSLRQVESLLLVEAVRAIKPTPASEYEKTTSNDANKKNRELTPFQMLHNIFQRVRYLFKSIEDDPKGINAQANAIAKIILQLYRKDSETLLGAVRLMHAYEYSICHPVHTAILCAHGGEMLKYEFDRSATMICAALTKNISMNELQDSLQEHATKVDEDQRAAIESHPEISVQMLKASGVEDSLWLDIVLQHHEKMDGTGYPNRLTSAEILQESMLVSLCDRYSAMMSGRTHRTPMSTQDIIKSLTSSPDCEPDLTRQFIGSLGAYPPGSFVKLSNGEVGIVVRRTVDAKKPDVASYIDENGIAMARPRQRKLMSVNNLNIVGHVPPDTSIPIDLDVLWGLQK